ncbi:Haloacid dehalogenase-like hydrolase [Alloactinosynnema sp. L-07]|uniref:HAD family hydrolase n=1 Tax=Alloactinosynnema sp. L-07 TaxID=1653480 RepID=UPI00065F0362|nr:haloacid dehalogenase-like hydrolase [Alloactinosynnema sp. L-07]CRK58550.1 Haloacid dehalogenase-like hydrolase [Alloactinosynnema sp. L-07]
MTDTLVLWDIDLTLVDYSGIGKLWYGQAVNAVLGVDIEHVPLFPGRTERSLTAEILTAHGAELSEDNIQRMFAELVRLADEADLASLGRALPGAAAILEALANRADVVQSLVTGNLPELADRKLTPFGLHDYVDFEIGGYGSLSEHRHDLVSAAMAAAGGKHGTTFAPRSVVVIGDTPHDVEAALHHGAVGVGVATGRHTAADLTAAGAHLVLDDLSDTPAVLSGLLGCVGSDLGRQGDQLPSGA